MAAVVARLDPQAAAKPAPAKLVAMANPPGSRPSHRRIDVKSAVVKPACEVIAPINRNIGIADNVQWAEKSYGMLFRTPNAALEPRMAQMPTSETEVSAKPIGTRTASSPSSATMPMMPMARLRSEEHTSELQSLIRS